MLLPCLGLALLAMALRNRPGAILVLDRGPFQLAIESVTREPVTAYEVSEGYDSSLKVVIGHKGGQMPAWWGAQNGAWGNNNGVRLMFEQNGKLRPVKEPAGKNRPLLYWRPAWDSKKERYVARILTHLSDVPALLERVVVQGNLAIQGQSSNVAPPLSAPLWFSHVVRESGEIIKTPVVSRDPSDVRLEKAEVGRLPPIEAKTGSGINGLSQPDVRVRIQLLRAHKDNSGSATGNAHLKDEKGRDWDYGGSSSSGDIPDAQLYADPLRDRRQFLSYDCNLHQIPRSAGRVWLTTSCSVNHAWPLEIKIPLRDAQGHILYTEIKPPPFIVESTQLRAADAQEKKDTNANTVLEVRLKYLGSLSPGRQAVELLWRADWSQHLIDEKGREYWKFIGPNNAQINTGLSGLEDMNGLPRNHHVVIQYYLPLQQMPARLGRLKFHADIGLPGTARVPVDVVVRESKPSPTPSAPQATSTIGPNDARRPASL